MLSTIDHDGDGDQRQSAGVEHQKHDHRIRSALLVRIQFLQSFHSFESERRGSVVQSQHVGRKIHKDVAHHRVPFWDFGKKAFERGPSHRANIATTPPFSPMRMMPIHSDNTPVSPREISKAVLAVSKVDAIMLGNTSVSPKKSNFTTAMTKAMRKNANQM